MTTLGMPASVSRIGFKIRRARGRAYSDRYIAAPSPSGVATTIAIIVTTNEPRNSETRSNSA
jgi:hypothetical protein